MTKGELRKARQAAAAAGVALTGELRLAHQPAPAAPVRRRRARAGVASREVQYGRYLDCGPGAWDDRTNPDY